MHFGRNVGGAVMSKGVLFVMVLGLSLAVFAGLAYGVSPFERCSALGDCGGVASSVTGATPAPESQASSGESCTFGSALFPCTFGE